jgi:hypothetical protein
MGVEAEYSGAQHALTESNLISGKYSYAFADCMHVFHIIHALP